MPLGHIVDLILRKIEILTDFLDHDLPQERGKIVTVLAPHI
jgi:hypothetical protein